MWIKRCVIVAVTLLVVGGLVFVWSWQYWRVNRRPFNDKWFSPIVQQYHVCDKCGSLDGGNYGKGPTRSFRSETSYTCLHQWRKISRKDFKGMATEQFQVDWSVENPFWAEDQDEK